MEGRKPPFSFCDDPFKEDLVMTEIKSFGVKCRILVAKMNRAFQNAKTEVVRSVHETLHVFRIMLFLHSAKDFTAILRLYGKDVPSGTE